MREYDEYSQGGPNGDKVHEESASEGYAPIDEDESSPEEYVPPPEQYMEGDFDE